MFLMVIVVLFISMFIVKVKLFRVMIFRVCFSIDIIKIVFRIDNGIDKVIISVEC